jgi:hypothetical protein
MKYVWCILFGLVFANILFICILPSAMSGYQIDCLLRLLVKELIFLSGLLLGGFIASKSK